MAHSSLWIVASFLSDEEVAVFGVVTRLVLLTGIALSVVNSVIPPLISKLSVHNQKDKLEKTLRLTASIAAIPAFIILLLFMVFGNYVLSSVFGVFYGQGAIILAILSFAQMVYVFVGSCGYVLVMNGFRKTMMFVSMGSMVLAVFLGISLVKLYGIFGVAIASALALIIQQLLLLYFARRNCQLWTHVDVFLPLRGRN
jgi:O-antigen/teichoic acid export membrane protein